MNQAKSEEAAATKPQTEYTPPPQTKQAKEKVKADELKTVSSKTKLNEKKTAQKKEKRKNPQPKEDVNASSSDAPVLEQKQVKPKSNLKKTKLNSVGQSTPKSNMSGTKVGSNAASASADDFATDIINALNETVSRSWEKSLKLLNIV